MRSLAAIVGPTSVGKSRLALELGQAFGAEIISADSRQVYRYMDIGTAKPTREERSLVPHHLIDVVDPDEEYGLAHFQRQAQEAIEEVESEGKLALLVGGSGLYVWSLLEGWRIPPVPPDPDLRRELEARAQAEGGEALYEELSQVDADAARRIDPKNVRRVIRALEVCRQGRPFSRSRGKESNLRCLIIGLTAERSELYRRIDARVDSMMGEGLVGEVENLVAKGYGFDLPSMSGLGYRQIGAFLRGEMDLPSAVQRIKYDTHRFVRHQYSWFALRDERIHWFDVGANLSQSIADMVGGFVAEQGCGGS
jgi:tRNA dimethylallyltransferase